MPRDQALRRPRCFTHKRVDGGDGGDGWGARTSRETKYSPHMSTHDPFDIKAQEHAARVTVERDKLNLINEVDDFKWLMGSRRGRRIVWRQLDRAGVFRLSFNTNAMAMAFAEGNKNEGLYTLSQIHSACPELYPIMLKEQKQ